MRRCRSLPLLLSVLPPGDRPSPHLDRLRARCGRSPDRPCGMSPPLPFALRSSSPIMVRRVFKRAFGFSPPTARRSPLAVIAFPDPPAAFHAYRLLQYHGISPEHLAIVGQGYCRPDRVGLFSPVQLALRRAVQVSMVTGSLGALAGTAVAAIVHLSVPGVAIARLVSLAVVAAIAFGFCGATLGALAAFLSEGNAASLYHHALRQGHCLLAVQGPEAIVRHSQEILSRYSTPQRY